MDKYLIGRDYDKENMEWKYFFVPIDEEAELEIEDNIPYTLRNNFSFTAYTPTELINGYTIITHPWSSGPNGTDYGTEEWHEYLQGIFDSNIDVIEENLFK